MSITYDPDRHCQLEIGQKDGMRECECGWKQEEEEEETLRSSFAPIDCFAPELSDIDRDCAGERDDTTHASRLCGPSGLRPW